MNAVQKEGGPGSSAESACDVGDSRKDEESMFMGVLRAALARFTAVPGALWTLLQVRWDTRLFLYPRGRECVVVTAASPREEPKGVQAYLGIT